MQLKLFFGLLVVVLLLSYAGYSFVESNINSEVRDCPEGFVKGGDSAVMAKHNYKVSGGVKAPDECILTNG